MAPDLERKRAAQLATPRIVREQRTVDAMLRIHCTGRHGAGLARDAHGLCVDCAALRSHARKRLALCPYGADKPTCANCRIHCYGTRQREAMREAMRYAGPRIAWRHPWLAAMHLLVDNRRAAPPRPNES